ncbi:hypothetical protein C2E23DRAFT_65934 [Lenzites betulinus]|nr:hypothetical protein C2E23DRAFT_65934 [Lenzites betulinus]
MSGCGDVVLEVARHPHCVAIDTPDSLDNVAAKWIEEVRSICGPRSRHPRRLQIDCGRPRRANAAQYVSTEQAERVAQAIGARAYKECSALKIEGVDDVFEAATRASMLMREGVPAHAGGHSTADGGSMGHRRARAARRDGRIRGLLRCFVRCARAGAGAHWRRVRRTWRGAGRWR